MGKDKIVNVSKSELINTFSEIDSKINNLHQRSAVDFMHLNDHLKDYHIKTRIISENAFNVIETISGNKEMNLTDELGKIYSRLDDCTERIKAENLHKVKVLKELLTKSNHLNVLMRNYKQDFTTFKFLATNFTLLSNYEDFGVSWRANLDKWNSEISVIQGMLTNVYSDLNSYKAKISESITSIELKVENSVRSLDNLSKVIRTNIDVVAQKSRESKLKLPLLKEKTGDSSKSISNIITHLQYHDIIRQKIEHIQKAHHSIIEDLKKSGGRNSKSGGEKLDHYYRIGDITDLQAAQLLLVSKEFQNAIDVITKNFLGIAKDITEISEISKDFSFNDRNSEVTLLGQIRDHLNEGIQLLDINDFRDINKEYSGAIRFIDKICEQFSEQIQKPLRELVKFENLKNDPSGSFNYMPGVVTQILLLTGDMEVKNYEICEKLNEIRGLSETVLSVNELDSLGSLLEQDRISLMVQITKILDSLDRDNDELDKVLGQNRSLNDSIIERIREVINRVDYYEYFEKIVEEVIDLLNKINSRLKPVCMSKESENIASNVESVWLNYTMESERLVHENVISGARDNEQEMMQASKDEIEFF